MNLKVKVEESRFVVLDKNDNVISIWSKSTVDEAGGLDKCIERYKKLNPKYNVEVIGASPAPAPAPAPAPEPAPAPAPAPAPSAESAPAPAPAPSAESAPAPAPAPANG